MGIYSSLAGAGGGGGGSYPTNYRGYELISTTTASNDSTIDITSLSEDLYLIVIKDMEFGDTFSSDRHIRIRTRVQGGSFESGATDYASSCSGRTSSGTSVSGNSTGRDYIETKYSSADTDEPEKRSYGEVHIMNVGSSSRTTCVFGNFYGSDGDFVQFSGIRNAAQDDDGIQFYSSAGNMIAGTFYLYKITEGV